MSKERLDKYKKMLDVMINDESEMHRNRLKDTAFYFYKQAIERVLELEEWRNKVTENAVARNAEYAKCREQNKRYREVIIDLNNLWKHVDSYDEFLNAVDEVTSKALEESE